jgi:DNA-binding CsgD family transcriptional regulator
LVGRERELALVAAVLDASSDGYDGVLLVGPRGVGTSWLARDAARRAIEAGRVVRRLATSAATASSDLAALAPLLDGRAWSGAGLDPLAAYAAVRASVEQLGSGDRVVLVADGVHHLDSASLAVLVQLARSGLVSLLATTRPAHVAGRVVQALDQALDLVHCPLAPFEQTETAELARRLLGAPLDGPSAASVHEATGGLPLAISEVVRSAAADGRLSLRHGLSHLDGELTSTAVLQQALLGDLDGVSSGAAAVLRTIAVAGAVPLDPLEHAGLLDVVLELDAGRLVVETELGQRPRSVPAVRVASGALRLAILGTVTRIEERAVLRRLVALVASSPGDHEALALPLARWRVRAGLQTDAALLVEATRAARAANDFRAVRELSELALSIEPTLELVLLHGEALYEVGAYAAAASLLREAEAMVTNPAEQLQVTVARHRLLLWGEQRALESALVLSELRATLDDPFLRDLTTVSEMYSWVFHGRPREALALRGELCSGQRVIDVATAFPLAVATMYAGRPVEARTLAEWAIVTTAGDAAAPLRAEVLAETLRHPLLDHLALHLADAERGRPDEAYAGLVAGYEQALRDDIPQLVTWFTLAAGQVALHQGRAELAMRHFVEGRAIAEATSFVPGRRLALTGTVIAAGLLGRVELVRHADHELETMGEDIGHLAVEVAWARSTARLVDGDVPGAIDELVVGIVRAASEGQHLLELELCTEAARLGAAGRVVEHVHAVAGLVDGDLAQARIAAIEALLSGSLPDLEAAETAVAACGTMLLAAELAERLAVGLHDAGRAREAARAARRALRHRDRCDGARLPVAPLDADVLDVELSAREAEVALHVAEGLSSKEIADRLCVSVRTVSNHLQHVYVRLGISSRQELVEVLREEPGLLASHSA